MSPSPAEVASFSEYEQTIDRVTTTLGEECPSLSQVCYLSGTMPVTLMDAPIAVSMDLDFRTREALESPREVVRSIKMKFKSGFEIFEADHDFGIYRGSLKVKGCPTISLDVMSSFEPARVLRRFRDSESFECESFDDYLRNKAQCAEERSEVKDLFHLCALARAGFEEVDFHLAQCDPVKLCAALFEASEAQEEIECLFHPPNGTKAAPTQEQFQQWIASQLEMRRGRRR